MPSGLGSTASILGYTSALKMETGKEIDSAMLQPSILASTCWRGARLGLRNDVVLVLEKILTHCRESKHEHPFAAAAY